MIFEPDPQSYRQDVSVRGMVTAGSFAALAAGVGSTELGQRWLHAEPAALLSCFAGYALIYAINVALMARGERLLRPEWWPMRVLGCIGASSLGCCFAAASTFEASPAWVLHLIIGLATGLAIRPTGLMLPVLLVPPLVLRAAFVPTASALSYGVLVVVSLGSYALYNRSSRLILRERQLAARTEAAGSLAEEARSMSAEFRVAMSLHDGLSGSLFALRQKLAQAADIADARRIVRAWLLRARSFLYRAEADDDVNDALTRLAASLGVTVALDVQVDDSQLDSAERADLLWIAGELVANAAAHDPDGALSLRVRAGSEEASVTANVGTRHVPAARRGRGIRNIELRAALHGGGIEWGDESMTVRWERRAPLESQLGRAVGEVVVVSTAFVVSVLLLEGSAGPLFVAIGAVLFLVLAFRDRYTRTAKARATLERAEQERLEAEESEILSFAGEALAPGVRRAERALAESDLSELGPAFDELAGQLRRMMWALEWSGDAESLREDVADFAREAGVEPPAVPSAALDSPRERWRTIARLSG